MNANELADRLEKILQHENSWDIDLVETIAMLAAPMLRQQQAEIEALKRPNNVVGVPCDELKKMQERLAHLEKMIVWYQDITMTGINSTDYENGFWDAVDFVKSHQVKDKN